MEHEHNEYADKFRKAQLKEENKHEWPSWAKRQDLTIEDDDARFLELTARFLKLTEREKRKLRNLLLVAKAAIKQNSEKI